LHAPPLRPHSFRFRSPDSSSSLSVLRPFAPRCFSHHLNATYGLVLTSPRSHAGVSPRVSVMNFRCMGVGLYLVRLDGLGTSPLLASSSPAPASLCPFVFLAHYTFAHGFFQPRLSRGRLAVRLPLPPYVRSSSFHLDSSCPCRAHGARGRASAAFPPAPAAGSRTNIPRS